MYDNSLLLRTLSEFSGKLLTAYDVDTALKDHHVTVRSVAEAIVRLGLKI